MRWCRIPGENVLLAAWLTAVAGASVWVSPPASWRDAEVAAYVIPSAGMVILALARQPPTCADRAWWLWPVCGWSFAYPFAFRPADPADPTGAAAVAARLAVLLLADLTLLTLGRSFAVLPAARTVRAGGAYRVVRHPVYALYALADGCFLLAEPSGWNAAVAASGAATFLVRAGREERVLAADPAYRAYAARVRWRFLPGVY